MRPLKRSRARDRAKLVDLDPLQKATAGLGRKHGKGRAATYSLTMRCASLRRDGRPCYATATWGRLYCPRHDHTVRWRPTGYPQEVRDLALELCQEVGPAEAARQIGLRSGTIRVWAHRAGLSSPHVPYEWARDVITWPRP
jgi:hypothetical protein